MIAATPDGSTLIVAHSNNGTIYTVNPSTGETIKKIDETSKQRFRDAFAVINDIEDDIRIREALKSQEAQLRLFADNIPGPIAYLDRSLRYTFVNQAFANWVCRQGRPQNVFAEQPVDARRERKRVRRPVRRPQGRQPEGDQSRRR